MDNYKHFIAGVNNVVLGVVYTITSKDDGVMPQVARFVKLIDAVKYEDGYYHTYYNEMKDVMKNYIVYSKETMDSVIKQADYLRHKADEGVDKALMVSDVVNTIHLWKDYENKFYKEFLPIESSQQQKIYEDLKAKFEEHMNQLNGMKLQLEKLDRKDQFLAFAKEQYAKFVESKEKVFLYTHKYLSMLLADHLPEIGGSLKEIINQTRNNLKQLALDRETHVNDLINKLYDKNKEQLLYRRRRCTSTSHLNKLGNDIDKIRSKVLNSGNHEAIWKVKEKLELFQKRFSEFERIAKTLNTLKAELEKIYKEEAIYNASLTTELPGSKYSCWHAMGTNFAGRKEELKQLLIKAAKALTTFFVVRSATEERNADRNEIGTFYVDLYGHMVYDSDDGIDKYHVDCEGNYWMPDPRHAAYVDDVGRYLLRNEEKIYQRHDCASLYKLRDDTLLKKVTTDCGHSESTKKDCKTSVKTQSTDVILPDAEPVDIKRTLNTEVVQYLWESVGSILPDALYDVCQQQPKNPIHYLAHSLLKHKYNKAPTELLRKKRESESYRAKILQERKEKAIAETKAWKAKQVQHRKPEESDDSYNRAVHGIYVATNQFIASLDYYN